MFRLPHMKDLKISMSALIKQTQLFDVNALAFLQQYHQVQSVKTYTAIELFAGAGGMALGFEKAGIQSVLLNEWDKNACQTLKFNRPDWHVVEGDIATIDFKKYHKQVDILSGGFPCQAFSYAGKKMGFEDIRGTLFFEFARAIQEVQPQIFIGENVRGLMRHDGGRTLNTMKKILTDLGYYLVEPRILNASYYQVPQKRERLFLIGIRQDIYSQFKTSTPFVWPEPTQEPLPLKAALQAGSLYPFNVPPSAGQKYPKKKESVLKLIPPGGYWRDLPVEIQMEYMKKSFYMGGGKTGIARRLSWEEPSLTLTCSPSQNQTERCHPEETRPLTVREYARIQTFPDEWEFMGTVSSQYKQIGNAVPVNLGYAVAKSVIYCLNQVGTSHSL